VGVFVCVIVGALKRQTNKSFEFGAAVGARGSQRMQSALLSGALAPIHVFFMLNQIQLITHTSVVVDSFKYVGLTINLDRNPTSFPFQQVPGVGE